MKSSSGTSLATAEPKRRRASEAAPVEPPASESLAETAYRRIEEMIVTRALPPDAMISENRLAEELGCGRTPIREALQRLRVEGYIAVHPRRGALVTPVSVLAQLDLLELRGPLEELVARLAAERATTAERQELRHWADELEQAGRAQDYARFMRANRTLHEVRVRATRNTMLVQHMRLVHGQAARFWYSYIADTNSFETAGELLARLGRAVADGNGPAAVEAAATFLRFLGDLTQRAIERRL
jgi:DNA-binding GntR family transcriptional regulator